MALIKCPECGKEISTTSKVCVHCGYKFVKRKNLFLVLSITIGAIAIISIFYYFGIKDAIDINKDIAIYVSVNENNINEITKLEEKFSMLNRIEKIFIKGYDNLMVIKNDYYNEQQAIANNVIKLIDDLGEITRESEQLLVDASNSYEALTDFQKSLVSNKEILDEAISVFELLPLELDKDNIDEYLSIDISFTDSKSQISPVMPSATLVSANMIIKTENLQNMIFDDCVIKLTVSKTSNSIIFEDVPVTLIIPANGNVEKTIPIQYARGTFQIDNIENNNKYTVNTVSGNIVFE